MLETLPKPFFVLAPMDDVTDTVFRQVVADCAPPDLFFTEFVNVEGLQSPGRHNLLSKLRFTANEQPLIAQIWGKNPENYYKTARELVDGTLVSDMELPNSLNFAGIDINMGCPDKTVVKNGACSALINNRALAEEIIRATQDGAGGKMPVSVKTRLGFNVIDLGWIEFLLRQNLDMLTIHLRTRKEMSAVPAHWNQIGLIREMRDRISLRTKIVGNGDVLTRVQGLELVREYGLDGVMIGRGIFHDPYVFAEHSPWSAMGRAERIKLFTKHVKLFAETWQHNERKVAPLNKFCKLYVNGFDGAKELRERLMKAHTADELLGLLTKA